MSDSGTRAYGIRELANWILNYAESKDLKITNMSLNKLIYFAYEQALLMYSRKLTNAKIEAWEHGPVFREVYKSFNQFGNRPITSRAKKYNPTTDNVEEVKPEISDADCHIIEVAIAPLVGLSASVLRDLSHASGGAWAETWFHSTKINPGMQISDDLIRSCYARKGGLQ